MSAVNTDGAAFPTGTGVTLYSPGMTLRDYFAAKAMQAFIAGQPEFSDQHVIAKVAYMVADTMLKARDA